MKEIYEMKGAGRSIREIARELDVSRNTVRRYLKTPEAMRPRPRRPRGSKLDAYTEHIDGRMSEGLENCRVLHREIRALGYDGSYSTVVQYVPRPRLHDLAVGEGGMSNQSTLLLEHHLKELKLAAQCAAAGADHPDYLLRLAELELIDRHQRMVERRIRAARFPATKSLDTFDFPAIPSVNKALVMQLARCEYVERRENVIGNSGTGKTHVALGLGLAACQKGMSVGFTTAAALVHELMEARDDRRLLNLQRQLSRHKLLIIDELGFVPLSTTGAELLFEVFSQRYERGSILVTTNLPFDEWTEVFGSERLTGALLDRLTHHVHILEMNGESYRLKGSRQDAATLSLDEPADA